MQSIRPIILSGGSGTRLWPLSRRLYPKQFMDIKGDTLFGQALARARALPGVRPPIVVCNDEQRFLAASILQDQGLLDAQKDRAAILLEPQGRNTGPAVALGALAAQELASGGGEDPVLLVLSSDHILSPVQAFVDAVTLALPAAQQGRLVVFGVTPTRAETGFGYICLGEALCPGVHAVEHFVEKPDFAKAKGMLAKGGYLWNSGMFLFRASTLLQELQHHAPEVHAACSAIWASRRDDLDFTRFSSNLFDNCPSISIDYALMEHTHNAAVVSLNAQWNDMGSWEAFYTNEQKDGAGNACVGDVLMLDSKNCYCHASHRLVAALGLEDISVVETPDAVLVLPRERSQDVKLLLDEMKRRGRAETDTHLKVFRPWGSYEVLVSGDRFQVKRIIVNPGGVLSLQLHHHRAEHWVVVRGTARIVVDDREKVLKEDESTYIPLGIRHRLENPGRIPLEIIEIQTGSYLGEDDIIRLEDSYGRKEE